MSVPAEIIETKPIEEKGLTIIPQATSILVTNEETKEVAGFLFKTINEALDQIGKVFNPLIESAKEAKRKADATRAAIVSRKEEFEAPWNKARAHVSGQLIAFKQLQDRIREEEEARLRQIAIDEENAKRKADEEKAMALAASLEAVGATEEAAQVVEESIQRTEAPVVVVVRNSVPKVSVSSGSFKTTWHAECFDIKSLCRAVAEGKQPATLVEANMTALNKLAVALHEQMTIQGCRAVPDTSMAKSRR